VTASDDPPLQSGDGRVDTGAVRDEEPDDESEAGRYDRYVAYVLDLLSFL